MKISRRNFIRLGVYGSMAAAASYPVLIESEWVSIKRITINKDGLSFVHISDIHFKGDSSYLQKVVKLINELTPSFVCFTGDMIEKTKHLDEALNILTQIKHPVYGCPGNHDHWSGVRFSVIKKALKTTGGDWLVNEVARLSEHDIEIVGIDGMNGDALKAIMKKEASKRKTILMDHYPAFVDEIDGLKFDIILAGHSHGGQVRIPFIGAPVLPPNVGKYDRGLFQTNAGPLYVNPGIGTWMYPVRLNCRPEITIIDI